MGVIEISVDMGKNLKVCRYALLFTWKLQVNKLSQKYLLYTSHVVLIMRVINIIINMDDIRQERPNESPILKLNKRLK